MTDDLHMEAAFGLACREERIRKGLTQDHIAKAIGISRASYIGLEAGRWATGFRNALALCKILSINPMDFVSLVDVTDPKAVLKQEIQRQIDKLKDKIEAVDV